MQPVQRPQYEIKIQSPFPEQEYPSIWFWSRAFWNKIAADDSPQTLEDFVTFERDRHQRALSWGVYRNAELGGLLEFVPQTPTEGVGHCLFKKTFWGLDTTRPAINLCLFEIFGGGIDLIKFEPFAHNSGIRSLLKRIGASEIGKYRGRHTQQGKPVDTVLYGLTCDDWLEQNADFVKEQVPPEPEAATLTALLEE